MDILKRNNVKVIGNGPQSIILAPGFGCDQSVWKIVTEAFKTEYTVILFDYVGSGESDILAYDPKKYSTLAGYAQDILDVCTALDLNDSILIGHSVGGMIGMLASIQQPKLFSKLVMIGPSPCYTNDPPDYFGGFEKEQLIGLLDMMEKNYIGWANMFAATVINNPTIPEVTRELEDRFCSTDPIIARQFAEATFFSDCRGELANVTIPTLILQCSDDIIAPIGVGEFIHQKISDSYLKIMEATGHCPHMSHPEETVQLIEKFIKKTYINS